MGIVSFGITSDQEEIVMRRMKTAGETNRSEHFRRVYFQGDDASDALIGDLKRQVGELADAVGRNQKLLQQLVAMRADGLEIKLLAALYMLLHPSVEPGVQATVDRHIDIAGVAGFLTHGKGPR
jgi:tetrahydromethanopterin S-methyltransferase subunit F